MLSHYKILAGVLVCLALHSRPSTWKFVSPSKVNHFHGWRGVCGNARYDTSPGNVGANGTRTDGSQPATPTPRAYRKHEAIPRASREESLRRLSSSLLTVRLNVVYDETLAIEHANVNSLIWYLRNLIFATQLIFEQPEMRQRLAFNLVVVSLKKSSAKFEPSMNSEDILREFRESGDIESRKADLNILLTHRNVWDVVAYRQRKILGLANVGSFCRNDPFKTLIFNANSLGMAIVLAHELGHSFNAMHDGLIGFPIEQRCNSDTNIMSPEIGPKKLTWSQCTVDSITENFLSEEVFACLFNEDRLRSAVPLAPVFDFGPKNGQKINPNRRPLPGEKLSLDEQCKLALDRTALSYVSTIGSNGNIHETCEDLVCVLAGFVIVGIGPAPAGSACSPLYSPAVQGLCFAGRCLTPH